MRDTILPVSTAIFLIAAGLFVWRVNDLADCRHYLRHDVRNDYYNLPKSGCPKIGPYGANSSPLLYALLSPLSTSAFSEPVPERVPKIEYRSNRRKPGGAYIAEAAYTK